MCSHWQRCISFSSHFCVLTRHSHAGSPWTSRCTRYLTSHTHTHATNDIKHQRFVNTNTILHHVPNFTAFSASDTAHGNINNQYIYTLPLWRDITNGKPREAKASVKLQEKSCPWVKQYAIYPWPPTKIRTFSSTSVFCTSGNCQNFDSTSTNALWRQS